MSPSSRHFTIPVEFTWTFQSVGMGGRVLLPEVGPVRPFAELGLARYRVEIDQKFQGDSNVQRSDVAHGMNGGLGASIGLGQVSLETEVRFHTFRFIVEGVELPWNANWLEVGVHLVAGLGG